MRIAALTATLVSGVASMASAQVSPGFVSQPALVHRMPVPPAGFHPVTASDAELAAFGLPARPHAAAAAAAWIHAMGAARTYIAPELRVDAHRHGPAVLRSGPRAGAFASTNWSGQALTNASTSFGGASYGEILAQWIVSSVQQAIGVCSGDDLSATWVGIDGFNGSGDVAQAGTEADASCAYGYTSQTNYAWFEWYPADSYVVTNFPVSRGAAVFVVVQIDSATSATATFVNLQNDQYTVIGFSAPAGTILHGNSAEFIVERPTPSPGASLGPLANFGQIAMYSEVAFLVNQLHTAYFNTPGTPSAGQTATVLTMVNGSGVTLATTMPQGPSAQVVQAAGPTQ